MQPNRKSASLSVLLYWPLDFNRIKTISLRLYFFENNIAITPCVSTCGQEQEPWVLLMWACQPSVHTWSSWIFTTAAQCNL